MMHDALWAPWRLTYLSELKRKADAGGGWDHITGGNFLAHYWSRPENDQANLVVHRDQCGFILLNRYPYANGHLLVALGDARPSLLDYSAPQRAAFWALVEVGFQLMQRALAPQGVNMGINEGRAAGAGVPEHLHAHLVPRWSGDTNFMTVTGNVRVIPAALETMWQQYRDAAQSLKLPQ